MKDIIEGSKTLLKESLELLGEAKNDIVIVGGWGPYLRHSEVHPGTRDVDILFPSSYSKDSMINILNNFLANGYFINAKHDFQLCRSFTIGKQTYIFNVDLLHPTEGKLGKVDFIDRMDLDVTVEGIKVKQIVTINMPHGEVIYLQKLYGKMEFENQVFNVLDGAGIVLTKLESCQNIKRERDIFDIYLSLEEEGTLNKLKVLGKINPHIGEKIELYRQTLTVKWKLFESNLNKYNVANSDSKKLLLLPFDD